VASARIECGVAEGHTEEHEELVIKLGEFGGRNKMEVVLHYGLGTIMVNREDVGAVPFQHVEEAGDVVVEDGAIGGVGDGGDVLCLLGDGAGLFT
jgi:hypothetical protein